jgi:chromosome partitioning protein
MEGLAHFLQTIKTVKSALNPGLDVEGGVLTMFDFSMVLSNQVKVEVEKYFDKSLFKTIIPRDNRLAEAPAFGQCIFQYDPKSKGAEAYADFARELLSRRGMAEDAADQG